MTTADPLPQGDALLALLDDIGRDPTPHLPEASTSDHCAHESEGPGTVSESPLKAALERLRASGVTQAVPLTVLSGFLGSGKTTLLRRMLEMQHGYRLAIIVNDMAEINVDAALVRTAPGVVQARDELVEMSNGCICCTLRGDLIEAVTDLVLQQQYEYIVIESTGISEPMPVAATFAATDQDGCSLAPYIRIDTMVTLLDCAAFSTDLASTETLIDRKMQSDAGDERTVVDLLVDQIEFADVIVANKASLVTPAEREAVQRLCARLNPAATVLATDFSDVPMEMLFDTGRFNYERAEDADGWTRELIEGHTPETEEYGISHITFRTRRPFHPSRLWDWHRALPAAVVRSKGTLWMAGINDVRYTWASAGRLVSCEPDGMWECATMERPLPDPLPEGWHEEYLDREQLLVFIGLHMDGEALRRELEGLLLTDSELADPSTWDKWENPFVPALIEFLGGEEAEID